MKKKLTGVAAILLLCAALFSVLSVLRCARGDEGGDDDPSADVTEADLFQKTTDTTSTIGVSYALVGTTERSRPAIGDEGLSRYPIYGETLSKVGDESDADLEALKRAILAENAYLNADPNGTLSSTCSNYDAMDADGYLYLDGAPVTDADGRQRRLYKHTAAAGMYFGDVSDEETAVIKRIAIRPRAMGNYITGLYAPAGEVMRLTIAAADLAAVGSFYIYVGATLANGQANNIWMERDFNRMPVIANKMPVDASVCTFDKETETYTCYFGSYLGGPIYVGSPSTKAPFQVEIAGAVEYPHLIYGLTTEAEYERLLASDAPYFDLEVFDNTVRFSGPRTYSDRYSYQELCEAALLWDKIARVSKQVPSGSNAAYGIDFLFDPFVAAGAAVAFVGRNTVNCPVDWMDGCLNVEKFVENGSWGNIHEFNHHFQNFGLPNGGEVTNNAVSLVSYSLFTRISAARSRDDAALTGWNAYTDPSRALRILLENAKGEGAVESLDAYATILHAFGQRVFIEATKNGSGVDRWYKNLCDLTHYDLSYYFTELLHETVSPAVLDEVAACGYPMYVPVASIYQTGTKYRYDGAPRQITTVQPFAFTGETYEFSVKSLARLPVGFTVTDVKVGDPQYGEILRLDDDLYRFIPSSSGASGDIDVTLSVRKDDGAFAVEDITLVFGFKRRQQRIAERTTYYFDSETFAAFADIDEAVNARYAGSVDAATFPSTFEGKECAAIWWNSEGVQVNAFTEYNAKIYIESSDTYRFSIRGKRAKLYISFDGISYEPVAMAGETYNNKFSVSVENGEYKDYPLRRGEIVYLRAVVMHADVERCACVVGMGTVVNGTAALDDVTKKTTAYHLDHKKEPFESDYFYTRADHGGTYVMETDPTSIVLSTNFSPWDETTELKNLFDGDRTTFMRNQKGEYASPDTPFEITVDLGREITANRITMYGRSTDTQTPKSYRLYAGRTEQDMQLMCSYSDEPLKSGCDQIGYFPLSTFRYYKLVVTDTCRDYICLSGISFSVDLASASLVSPDDADARYYGTWALDYDLALYGHSYVTASGFVEFDFVGSTVAVLTKAGREATFTVSIDGGEERVCVSDGQSELLFLDADLEEGEHSLVIKAASLLEIVAFVVG